MSCFPNFLDAMDQSSLFRPILGRERFLLAVIRGVRASAANPDQEQDAKDCDILEQRADT
jgi:hypothetical protein